MDKYIVNGVEIEYDTFDLDSIECWEREILQVSDETNTTVTGESPTDRLRRICNAFLDFFDAVCGGGTARKVFGDHVNVKDIYTGYGSFVQQVSAASNEFTASIRADRQPTGNRAQRRAAELGKR